MSEDRKTMCPQKQSCAMFSLFSMSGTLRIWQDNYCDTAFDKCERYQRFMRGERVPKELMPNGKSLALAKK